MNTTNHESPFRTTEGARWMNPMRAEAIFWALMRSGEVDTNLRFLAAKRWAKRLAWHHLLTVMDTERHREWNRRAAYANAAWDRAVR